MGQLVCHHHCYDLLYNLNRVHFLNRHFQNPTIHQMLWWILQIDFLHPPPPTRVCVYSDIGQTEKVFLFWYVFDSTKFIFLGNKDKLNLSASMYWHTRQEKLSEGDMLFLDLDKTNPGKTFFWVISILSTSCSSPCRRLRTQRYRPIRWKEVTVSC